MDLLRYPKRYKDYNTFLQEKFGEKVYKIAVDAGFTCPNRDGTVGVGGCIYCNNASFSPMARQEKHSLAEQIRLGMEVGRTRFKAKKFLAYFQAYTNTYATVAHLNDVYRQVLDYPEVAGIIIGTRPDAVDAEKLGLLQTLARDKFVSIEYGVQSVYNATLQWINRGHTYEDFVKAMELTRGRGIHIGAHIMLGFPHETRAQMLAMAARMNEACIDAIKIHNLLITRDTVLEGLYARQPFPVFAYEEYVELVCDFLERLEGHVAVERLCATTTRAFLIAPDWKKSAGALANDVTKNLARRNSYQGKLCNPAPVN